MSKMFPPAAATDQERARHIVAPYRLVPGVYVLGCLEKGVTVYRQQVRAHNLVWALSELARSNAVPFKRVAIIGGGIAGLTATACLLSHLNEVRITLFERRLDLCPRQQGSDHRWLHPRIYDWPRLGSRAPEASLPVLNWSEGRASDVARQMLEKFGAYCRLRLSENPTHGGEINNDLRLYLGVNYLRVNSATGIIEWSGRRTVREGSFFRAGTGEGSKEHFDAIIVAAGFGEEQDSSIPSYWRNDQLGQPILAGAPRTYVVSGYGDGAIIDLCRLAIERFRQDTILYELFDKNIDVQEDVLRAELDEPNGRPLYEVLSNFKLLEPLQLKLNKRLRKDVKVILHAAGRSRSKNNSMETLLAYRSSFLNKFLLYLLHRCDAFTLSLNSLTGIIKEHRARPDQVVRRYGTKQLPNVLDLFSNQGVLKPLLISMKERQGQQTDLLWKPGSFRHIR